MSDIFLSYVREDKARVAPLVARLRFAELDVWWDDDILPDQPWEATIEQALADADTVVVCWSRASVASENVRAEARWAKGQGKLIQVFIDRCDPPLFFGERQGIDLARTADYRDDPAIERLITRLRERTGATNAAPVAAGAAIPVRSRFSRRAMIAGAGSIAITAASTGGWLWWRGRHLVVHDASIAVMPFANLSGDPAQSYFSDGISEELRTALGNLPRVRVIGRTSSEKLRDDDAVDVAKKLNVSNVLTGSLRRSPTLIRVSAQLIDGATGVQLWSNSYDRAPGDALSIQTGIARDVAQSLRITLAANAAAITAGGTASANAHDLYLKARAMFASRATGADLHEVVTLADSAIVLDPRYADAHLLRALALANIAGGFDTDAAASQADYVRAADAARRAIALAPDLAAGYATLGAILADQLHIRDAAAQYQRAAGLGQDGRFLESYSRFLGRLGDADAAIDLAGKAVALDPLDPLAIVNRAEILLLARRFEAAAAAAHDTIIMAPDNLDAHLILALSQLFLGHKREAGAALVAMPADNVYVIWTKLIVAARAGETAEADRLQRQLEQAGGDAANYQYAMAFAQRGKIDKAFAALDRGWAERDPGLFDLRASPLADPLRGDPRFATLIAKLDFP
ncbi:MAG: TIR domain-containing protein [Proteobacteria bacterium]|nr:TIR domain-containing protein [Pseudomonadota bacterium]